MVDLGTHTVVYSTCETPLHACLNISCFHVLNTLCGNTQSHQAGKVIKLGKKGQAARKKALANAMKRKNGKDDDSSDEDSDEESEEEDEGGSESGEGDTKRDRAKVRKFHLIFGKLPDHVQEVWKQVFFFICLVHPSSHPERNMSSCIYIYIYI